MAKTRRTEVISAFVTGCATQRDAERAARIDLIDLGKTPDYPVHAEDLGDGEWEVLFTTRALAAGSSYVNGVRVNALGWDRA